MDEAYFQRFHDEMVATRLIGWRRQRQTGIALAVVGGLGCIASAATVRPEAAVLAVLTAALGFWALKRLEKRRHRWLTVQRGLPIYGAKVEVELDGWQLVLRADRSDELTAIAAGELVESPRGWFVTYDTAHLSRAPTQKASAWIPHAFEPPIARDTFAAALDETFSVRRR